MTNPIFDVALKHRSIRSFTSEPLPDALLDRLLATGLRSSSSGNMQTWSVVVTRDDEQRRHLYEAHWGQKMLLEAPVVLTFCADVFRMREWVRVHGAKQSFDDLLGFLTGAVDAVIAAQTICLAAESVGLGICYLGSTWPAAPRLIDLLALPRHVFPVTSVALGYPAEQPPLRDRLPLDLIVHREKYHRLSDEEILASHADRSRNAWQRYTANKTLRRKLAEAGITHVTDFYTSEFKYSKDMHRRTSQMLIELLQTQGLWL